MTENQLDNILRYYILVFFNPEQHVPDYLMEKWDKIVGADFKIEPNSICESVTKYTSKWKIDVSDSKITNILILNG